MTEQNFAFAPARRPLPTSLFLVLTAIFAAPAPADDEPRLLRAVALAEAPVLDGDVLGEELWQAVPAASAFTQVRPFAGEGESERTEVRVGYTAEALYLAVVCYDSDPGAMIVSDSRRDASMSNTDSFQVILDTFHDRRNGFVFGTNPAGAEYDGQVINEGRGGSGGRRRQRAGSGGGFNLNWDGAWRVEVRVSQVGWSAEMAIPFSTLRYPKKREQRWGLNFQRNIGRRVETAFWAPLDRQFNLYRLSDAGVLEGLVVPPQKNLQLAPYLVASAQSRSEGADETDADFGADLKYSVTPSLTLDATYNTDFAQVEVDERQINLDRFSLFFPEKRPFFLENAGLFAVGSPGEAELFFSRRIGIDDAGRQAPIAGGLRLSGKVGRTDLGLLGMQSEGRDGVSGNRYSVARVRRELAHRSSLGALVVDRRTASGNDSSNQTYAVDGKLGVGEYLDVSAFAATTRTAGVSDDDHAFQLGASYDSEKWRGSLDYIEVGEGFNPEVGFLSRRGYRKPSAFLLRRIRPQSLLGFHELRPHVSYRGYWDFSGFQETGFLHVDNHWEWRSGYEVHTGINFLLEGVKAAFEIAEGVVVPPGTYRHDEIDLVFLSDAAAPFSASLRATVGGFFGGDRVRLDPTLRLRLGEVFIGELTWSHNDIDLPGGAFKTNLGRLRLSYAFTQRLFLQSLIQYNDRSDDLSFNLRLSWLDRANTGLFVVYNEVQEIGARGERAERSLIVKYSRLFDLLH